MNTRLLELVGRNKKHFYVYTIECRAGELMIPSHWHNELEIIYAECEGSIRLDTNTVAFEKNSVIFVNKAQLHPVTTSSAGKMFAMVFDLEFLDFKSDDYCQQEILDALKNQTYIFPPFTELNQDMQGQIKKLLREIIQLYYSSVTGRELKIKCNLYEIIFLLYSNDKFIVSEEEGLNSERLSYVKETIMFMENNYAETITVDELASNVNISKYYLIKTFKEITGETPMVYLRNLRIDVSKKMLEGGLSVTQAALKSGFNNVSYYIRHFKDRNHMTPKEYQCR